MESRIGRWGGSCAIRLPKMAVESLGLREGEFVHLEIDRGVLVIRPARNRYRLADLVAAAKKLDLPEVIDVPPEGDELL